MGPLSPDIDNYFVASGAPRNTLHLRIDHRLSRMPRCRQETRNLLPTSALDLGKCPHYFSVTGVCFPTRGFASLLFSFTGLHACVTFANIFSRISPGYLSIPMSLLDPKRKALGLQCIAPKFWSAATPLEIPMSYTHEYSPWKGFCTMLEKPSVVIQNMASAQQYEKKIYCIQLKPPF